VRAPHGPRGLAGRILIVTLVIAGAVGAWWSGSIPCPVISAQPACRLAVSGGPVLDTGQLLSMSPSGLSPSGVTPSGATPSELEVREPAGQLLVTTIEVWELDGVAQWWSALRDPHIDLVARALLVPPGGDLADVAESGRARMVESRELAVGLALESLGLIADADVPAWAWPVEVSFATDEVGGPSAGLMLALSAVARLAPTDPTARPERSASGRAPLRIAGTGALEADGRVVGVGGVEHKLRSVVAEARGGALPDAFLVPLADLPVARRARVSREVLLVPVEDLVGALRALEVLAAGDAPAGSVLLASVSADAR
jgi:PDZ domain-containing secreted protein